MAELPVEEHALQEEAVEENEVDVRKLKEAVEKGDIETLLDILKDESRNLCELVPDCHKLLIDALQHGFIDVATLLVSKGVPVNCRSATGWTPLHIAAGDSACYELIQMMLERGAEVNAEISMHSVSDYLNEEAGDTPLHRASFAGNLDIVKLLLQHGADCNKTNTHVTSPLIIAVKGQWVEVSKILLEHGADVHEYNINPPSLWCLTPLDWAMSQLFALLGSANLCKVAHHFLSWDPSDISKAVGAIPSKVQLSPSQNISLSRLLNIIELLVNGGASDNIIIQTIKFRYPEEALAVATTLVERGARLDVEDQRGISLMQVAACVGYYDLMKLFLDSGAACDIPNHCGWTPLMITLAGFREIDVNVVRLLLEYGADVNAQDDKGKTPLMIAIPGYIMSTDNKSKIIEFLLDHGANINQADSDGDTPLLKALSFRKRDDNDDLVELLLSRGAEVNTVNNENNTPLHIAILKYDRVGLNIIKMIIDRGADINARDSEGNTPLMLAIACCFSSEIAELLIDRGADIEARNNNGHTPFQLAVIDSRSDVISQLLVKKIKFDPKDLLEDVCLLRLVIGTIPYRRREVVGIQKLSHRDDILKLKKNLVDSYIQQYHADRDAYFRGRVYVALWEGLRNSSSEIKCITTLGSPALLFTIVESRVLDLKLKGMPVPDKHLSAVLSYRIKIRSDNKTYNTLCNREIRRMRLYRLTDWVNLYEVVTKEHKKAAAYARNDEVSQKLRKLYHQNNADTDNMQFPIFCNLLNIHIQNALARVKLLAAGEECLNSLFLRSRRIEELESLTISQNEAPSTSSVVPNRVSEENQPSLSTHSALNLKLPIVVSDAILNLLSDEELQNMIVAECGIQSEDLNLLHAEWREELLKVLYREAL